MKIEELRIGNWVDSPLGIGEVVALDSYESNVQLQFGEGESSFMDGLDISEIEPIPLTDDILIKSGWKTTDSNVYTFGKDIALFVEDDCGVSIHNGRLSIFCQYVHELQNLLYFFGRKDIEIKL